jgi:hypothetical protein
VAAAAGLGLAYVLWKVSANQSGPTTDRHLIVMGAEDLNRLQIIAETHAAGEQVWFIKEKGYERDKRKVVALRVIAGWLVAARSCYALDWSGSAPNSGRSGC